VLHCLHNDVFAVLMELQLVRDRQTDGHRAMAHTIASCGKNPHSVMKWHILLTCSISLRLLKPFLSNCFSMTRALAAYESAISFYTRNTNNITINWATQYNIIFKSEL